MRTLLLIPLVFMIGCNGTAPGAGAGSPWGNTSKLKVLTSIVPINCLTASVAGDDAVVLCLMSTHGPHDFSPTAEDVKVLSEANLLIVNGLSLESFLKGMVKNAGNRGLKVVHVGNSLPNDRLIQTAGTTHYHGDKLVTHPGSADPHVWLGLDEATLIVDTIRDVLIDRDAVHAEGYRQRAEATKQRLTNIKADFQDLATGRNVGIITFHDSFRYLARTFHLNIVGTIRDVRGDQPLSLAELREQAEEFRNKNVHVIGVEPQYPRGVAENLAKEMGGKVKIIELDPIETGPHLENQSYRVDKDYYFQRMETNLQHLRQALR